MPDISKGAAGHNAAEDLSEGITSELPDIPDLPSKLPPIKREFDDGDKDKQNMGLAYVLPSALAAPVVVLTGFGYWCDGRFQKSPWFTLTGALLGMVSGFINMMRIANKLDH